MIKLLICLLGVISWCSIIANEIRYHNLGKDVTFAYDIVDDKTLEMLFVFPEEISWIIAGFHNKPYSGKIDEDLVLLGVVLQNGKIRPYLKACHIDDDNELVLSDNYVYDWGTKSKSEGFFHLSVKRDFSALQYESPLTFLWAFGTGDDFSDIAEAFNTHKQTALVTLLNPQGFVIEGDASIDDEGRTSLPTTTTTISTVTEKVSLPKEESRPTEKATIKKTMLRSKPLMNFSFSSLNITTPCPTQKCNCSKASEWFKVFQAKENTVYFAVIGSSALFTGLIVLCIACCCARKSAGLPKKHKVAFYKVDNFESDVEEEEEEDEEVEFLKNKKNVAKQ